MPPYLPLKDQINRDFIIRASTSVLSIFIFTFINALRLSPARCRVSLVVCFDEAHTNKCWRRYMPDQQIFEDRDTDEGSPVVLISALSLRKLKRAVSWLGLEDKTMD